MTKEPLITTASITAGVVAVLALLTAFGLPLTDAQQQAILGVVAVAAPLAVGLLARSQVTPNASVVEAVEGGTVVAGEASEQLPAGTVIRAAGEWPGPETVSFSGDERVYSNEEVRRIIGPETGADGVEDAPRRSLDD